MGLGVGGLGVGVKPGEVGVGLNEAAGVCVGDVAGEGEGVGCRGGCIACRPTTTATTKTTAISTATNSFVNVDINLTLSCCTFTLKSFPHPAQVALHKQEAAGYDNFYAHQQKDEKRRIRQHLYR
jgi:hypothetical protein